LALQDIMGRIGKPEALGPLDENMPDDEDDEEQLDDGIPLPEAAAAAAGDALAEQLGRVQIQ
jgi:hypothetical protein